MKRMRFAAMMAMFLAWAQFSAVAGPSIPSAPPSEVGTTLPADFPVIINPYLGVPALGFGAKGSRIPFPGRHHVPVIFLHGNNDSPFPTTCNPFGYIHNEAQYFLDNGYQVSELWGLGYEGDLCDLLSDPTLKSGIAHSTAAGVPLLRAFVRAVLAYTGSRQVDIVAHSLGVTIAREWMFQDHAYSTVRSLVAIDGPNHGIIDCSPDPANYFQLPANGGFTPNSAVCDEYGSDHTQLLTTLNAAGETPGPTRYLVIRNVARSSPESGDFVYLSAQDGFFGPVPAEDRDGVAHDFSDSALLAGAPSDDLTGQGQFDAILGTAHLGILNSAAQWSDALNFLNQ
jgi:Lipase (class 2)